ncbi:MAG: hypothetical protein QME16_00125 [Planctomycetota bacterium]|nr:hypothetical protein [Planctomycetota bacterium]
MKEKKVINIERVNKELDEIAALKKIKENITEEISKLQITLSNLEAQKHSADVKKEYTDKVSENETYNKFAAEERKIEIKRIEAEKRIDTAELIERKINDRELEVQRREQKTMELESKISELNKQRANFEIYKTSINDQLNEAKITIAEAGAMLEKIEAEKQSLVAREKGIKQQEKWWNDRIGELNSDMRKFEIEKENFLGLKKEEANV